MNGIFYLLSFIVIIVMLLVIHHTANRIKTKQELYLSGMIIFTILNWICVFIFNSLAYIFTIPLCFLFLYSFIIYLIEDYKKIKFISYGYMAILGFVVLIIYTPIIHLFYTAFLSTLLVVDVILVSLTVLPIAIIGATCVIGCNNFEEWSRK